jgi:hypothetical protein
MWSIQMMVEMCQKNKCQNSLAEKYQLRNRVYWVLTNVCQLLVLPTHNVKELMCSPTCQKH